MLVAVLCALATGGGAAYEEEAVLAGVLDPQLLLGPDLDPLAPRGANSSAGDFDEALETMSFHRRMMNEYLCRGYVAGQILGEVLAPRVQKRLGSPPPRPRRHPQGQPLLADPGSAKYNKWLARTTTLEDIYRRYDAPGGGEARQRPFPPPRVAVGKTGYSNWCRDCAGSGSGGGHSSYGGGGGGGGKAAKADKGSMKNTMDIALTAMAVLSFLMFKVNILACLLKRMMTPAPTPAPAPAPAPAPTVMMLPALNLPAGGGSGGMFMFPAGGGGGAGGGGMLGGGAGGGPGGGGLDLNLNGMGEGGGLNIGADGRPIDLNFGGGGMMMGRRRREAAGSDAARADLVARRALESLEALHLVRADGGGCLRLWLCENNRLSRQLDGRLAAWLPLWGFGMSWLGGKMARSQATAAAMLDNLRAAVLGLGDSECDVMFPDCSQRALRGERANRQRRQRRSRRGDTRDL